MRRASVAVLFCAIALTMATPRAAGQRFITETDLFKFTWIADPQISPDGSTVAFVRVTVNEKENRYESSLYAVPTAASQSSGVSNDTPRRLTSGIRDTSPRWAPDGKRIAFVRAIEKDGKVQPAQIYLLAMEGGEARPLSELANGEFDEGDIRWSGAGSTIYFTSTRMPEAYYEADDSDLSSVPAAGGSITKVASIDGSIGGLSLSPDGKRIAFVGTLHGNPVRSYSQPDLWVTDVAPGSTPKNLTANYDFDISSGIGGDQSAPRGRNATPIVWSKDSSTSSGQAAASLIVVVAEHGSANMKRVTIATGKIDPVTDGKYAVAAYSATPDGSAIATTISTQTNIGDVFVVNSGGARSAALSGPRQITHINDDIFKEIQQSEPEEIWYRTFDGKQVQGWILKPPDFDSTKKYPLILEIHGGPHAAYGNAYTHEFQWMAAKGYVVLFTNPRGSTSYGQDFGNIIQYHYPGDDYKDLMAGVDEVLKKGYVDATRLGVTGGSGGGLLTNWTITQTQRFKAAVSSS